MSTDSRPRVIITDPIAKEGIDLLRENFDVDLEYNLSPEELMDKISDYSAIIVRSRIKVTRRLIEAGRQLQAIGRAAAGLDNIDVKAAREWGIKVLNCPGANSVAVAEHTMGLILSLARHIPRADRTMKGGEWAQKELKGLGLTDRTLGIIGFGRIGGEVAKRAAPFGMRIIVNQPRLTPELALQAGVERYDLHDLLRESDFVTVHVPLRSKNIRLIGSDELDLMKSSAYLINTARGGIVDEDALLEALNNGAIAGAGVDVYANEPAINHPLAQHSNVVASPHIAASTDEAQHNAAVEIAEQIIESLAVKEGVAATLSLQIVPTERIFPHEAYDEKRVNDLAAAVRKDGMLVNPPIVAHTQGQYIVLDGATRTTAFKQMGIRHMVVQVMDENQPEVQLNAWHHLIRGASPEEFVAQLLQIEGLRLTEVPQTALDGLLEKENTLAYFMLPNGTYWLAEVADESFERLEVLNRMVAHYTNWGRVARTIESDLESLRLRYPEMAALALYSPFKPSEVVQAGVSRKLVPAGITRFIITGRVLRLNMPLEVLESNQPLIAKRRWLDQYLGERLARQRVRYYQEPVVLLED
ncbi:MAG: NAD(P)-dependent oxidoreductase [Ardenticatenaceae bacterium]